MQPYIRVHRNGWEQNKLAEDKHYPKSVPEGPFLPQPSAGDAESQCAPGCISLTLSLSPRSVTEYCWSRNRGKMVKPPVPNRTAIVCSRKHPRSWEPSSQVPEIQEPGKPHSPAQGYAQTAGTTTSPLSTSPGTTAVPHQSKEVTTVQTPQLTSLTACSHTGWEIGNLSA